MKTKRLLILILGGFLASASYGQNAVVKKYFDQYADNEAYTKVSVSSKAFALMTELDPGSPEEKEFLTEISKLKGLKMIKADSVPGAGKTYKTAVSEVLSAGFEELMSVKDNDGNFMFAIKEKSGVIEELIMVGGSPNSFALVSLYGIIDLKSISKIAGKLRVKGLEDLQKLDKKSGN